MWELRISKFFELEWSNKDSDSCFSIPKFSLIVILPFKVFCTFYGLQFDQTDFFKGHGGTVKYI